MIALPGLPLPTPDEIAAVPAEQLPEVLGRLEALKALAWARLTARMGLPTPPQPPADEVVGVVEAARLVRRSASWMRKHGQQLPGFHQPTGRGGRVGWRRGQLVAWAAGEATC
jgi:hypothetical protein